MMNSTERTESNVEILVIEDEKIVRDVITGILEREDFTVYPAEDGQLGLEMFHSNKFDLVLTDLRMPQVDGLDVLAEIAKESPETPIIVVSGLGTLDDAVEALRLGAWDYIIKPFKGNILIHSVRKALERSRLIDENRAYREYLEEEIKNRTEELERNSAELETANKRLLEEIAEQKRLEDVLKTSEVKYRSLVENQTELIIEIDREGKLLYVNDYYCKMFGNTPDELVGKSSVHLVCKEDRDSFSNALKSIFKPPYTFKLEQRALTKHGWKWISWIHKALFNAENNLVAMVGVGRDITERKRTEEELKKSHEKFQTVLEKRKMELSKAHALMKEHSTNRIMLLADLKDSAKRFCSLTQTAVDAVICIEAGGVITLWNESAEKMFGYSMEEALGRKMQDLIVPERYRKRKIEGFERFFKTGKGPVISKVLELNALRKDGSEFPIELSVSAVKMLNGWWATGVVRDITLHKWAEEALNIREIQARELLDAHSDSGLLVDTEGVVFALNDIAVKELGKSRDALIGSSIYDIFPSDMADNRRLRAAEAVNSNLPVHFEERHNGSCYHNSLYPISNEQGEVVGLAVLLKEITDLKQKDVNLKLTGMNLRDITENLDDGIFIASVEGKMLYANIRALKMTDYSFEELSGINIKNLIPPADFEKISDEFSRKIKFTYTPDQIESKIFRKDGDTIPVEVILTKTVWKGEAANLMIIRDITNHMLGLEKYISRRHRRALRERYTFEDIVSQNPEIQRICDILPAVAESNTTVLVVGESGTGKELLVQAIHNLSSRCKKPLIILNCGALPDTLLESELFGYKTGAFTDAKKDKKGYFARANGGTIFLDEIGDISPMLQLKLLRVLQDKSFVPLGGEKLVKVDVRVITATNQDLNKRVEEGSFRQDLYFRLNVIQLELPPLRQRKEDIPLLVDHFIEKIGKIHHKNIREISPEALSALLSHNYPGNIRELENIIERAMVLCGGDMILPEHLPNVLSRKFLPREAKCVPGEPQIISARDEFEAQLILSALKRHHWNRRKSAETLGIDRTTLYRKMLKLGIKSSRDF